MKITIYGSKGSLPFFSNQSLRRGGNTSCVKIDTEHGRIVLDCGSGLAQLSADMEKEAADGKPIKLDILLSHLHMDHIIGLSVFKHMWKEGNDIRLYTKSRNQSPLVSQVFGVFKPPYWPVDLGEMCKAQICEIKEGAAFMLDAHTKVTPFSSAHQDDTTAFRIDAEKTVVYLLDYEMDDNPVNMERLAEFCSNSDIVIFDSSYLPKDIESKRGWGHSTYEEGITLAEKSGCKQMIFSHFSYEYTDDEINQIEKYIQNCGDKFLIAYDGLELVL